MRYLLALMFISLVTFGWAQSNGSQNERDLRIQQRKFKKDYGSQTKIKIRVVDPKLVDEFIESIKESNIGKTCDMIDSEVMKKQSKEQIAEFFELQKKYYGDIIEYDRTLFATSVKEGVGQLVTVIYDLNLGDLVGNAKGVFRVCNKRTVKMLSFKISLNDYTRVDTFEIIAKPVLEAIRAEDTELIYSLMSSKFKELNTFSDFKSKLIHVLGKNLADIKMFRSQVARIEGVDALRLFYELSDKSGYLSLLFTKEKDQFGLDELNYLPNE